MILTKSRCNEDCFTCPFDDCIAGGGRDPMYYRKYYETHKEQIKKARKKYVENHKEQVKEQSKKYYYANRDEILRKQKEKRKHGSESTKQTDSVRVSANGS